MNTLMLVLIGIGIAVMVRFIFGKKLARKLSDKWAGGALDRCFREWEQPYMTVTLGAVLLIPVRLLTRTIKTAETVPVIALVIILSAVVSSVFFLIWDVIAEFIRRREGEKPVPPKSEP